GRQPEEAEPASVRNAIALGSDHWPPKRAMPPIRLDRRHPAVTKSRRARGSLPAVAALLDDVGQAETGEPRRSAISLRSATHDVLHVVVGEGAKGLARDLETPRASFVLHGALLPPTFIAADRCARGAILTCSCSSCCRAS